MLFCFYMLDHCSAVPDFACASGSGLAGADSSVTLTATGSNYTPGKFPHLAGCKILTLPELSLDLVWLCAHLLPLKASNSRRLWSRQGRAYA